MTSPRTPKRNRHNDAQENNAQENNAQENNAQLAAVHPNLWPKLLADFSPRKAATMGTVSQAFNAAFHHSDEARFLKHFPHFVAQFRAAGTRDWRQAFCDASLQDYGQINDENEEYTLDTRKERLFYHVKEGNLVDLIRLNITYFELFFGDNSGYTLLAWALNEGCQKMLDHFYQIALNYFQQIAGEGNMITAAHRDARQHSLMHFAVICRQPLSELKHMITDLHYDVNQADAIGCTPFMLAIHQDTLPCVQLLLEHGAQLEQRSNTGNTPVIKAVLIDAPNVVRLLLERRADIHVKCTQDEYSALSYAAYRGFLECVQVLTEPKYKGNINILAIDRTPLYLAAMNGHVHCVNTLLQRGADPFIVTDLEETPVYIAAQFGHIDVLRAILSHHSHDASKLVHKCTLLNTSPLMAAAEQQSEECVEFLVSCGAKPDQVFPNQNCTALMMLAQCRAATAAMSLLIKHGADVNFANNDTRFTALHMATFSGNIESMEFLLKNGADYQQAAHFTIDFIKGKMGLLEPEKRVYFSEYIDSYPEQDKSEWTAEDIAVLMNVEDAVATLSQHRMQKESSTYKRPRV